MWTDSHCHLTELDDPDGAVGAARAEGVGRLVTVGTDEATSRRGLELARRHEEVWATAGIHPHEASGGTDGLGALLEDPDVVAVGECGLDYHYDHSPRPAQRAVFAEQVAMAAARDLALVVHSREAWDDTFAVLEGEGRPGRVVLHCFTGGPAEARRALDLGAHLSFSGIVTFRRAAEVRAAAAITPLERLLVETDAPFLAPVPHRGRPNRPAWLPIVGTAVAAAGGVDVEAVRSASSANAARLFGASPGAAAAPCESVAKGLRAT